MTLVDPIFEAGELVGKNILYSHSEFNGLFSLNTETGENKFIRHFEDLYTVKKKHSCSMLRDNKIVFMPGYGNYIDIVDCESFEIKRIELNRYTNHGSITGTYICFDNKLIICPIFVSPHKLELPFFQIDLESFEVKERWDINDKVREVCAHVGETCLWYGAVYEKEVFAVINQSDKVVKIDLKKELVEKIDTKIDNLYGVSVYGADIWLVSKEGALVKWNNKKADVLRRQCGNRKARYLEKVGDKFFLIPEYDDSITVLAEEKGREKLKLVNKVFNNVDYNSRTFSWYRVIGNNLYLFSDRYCSLVEFECETGNCKVKDVSGSTIWPHTFSEQKCMRNVMASTYEESEYYSLEEFCNDILKL